MMGIEKTQDTFGDAMRKSYDRYAMAAQFRNAVIREQLEAMQDFVAISDKLLRLPFPGLIATDRSKETYKDLAVQMQNVIAEHSNSTLEIWASMFGYEGPKAAQPVVAALPAQEKQPAPAVEAKREAKPKAKPKAAPKAKPKAKPKAAAKSKPKTKADGQKAAGGSARTSA
jgi:outer membrane biosynthesis protein TonB